jgi:A/G-specific adenine glycosylase
MPLALRADGSVLLLRRPERGVWGGLWCLPEHETEAEARAFLDERCGSQAPPQPLPQVFHAFTHFDLVITPLLARCAAPAALVDEAAGLWYNTREPARVGLPAPIKTLLEGLPELV